MEDSEPGEQDPEELIEVIRFPQHCPASVTALRRMLENVVNYSDGKSCSKTTHYSLLCTGGVHPESHARGSLPISVFFLACAESAECCPSRRM